MTATVRADIRLRALPLRPNNNNNNNNISSSSSNLLAPHRTASFAAGSTAHHHPRVLLHRSASYAPYNPYPNLQSINGYKKMGPTKSKLKKRRDSQLGSSALSPLPDGCTLPRLVGKKHSNGYSVQTQPLLKHSSSFSSTHSHNSKQGYQTQPMPGSPVAKHPKSFVSLQHSNSLMIPHPKYPFMNQITRQSLQPRQRIHQSIQQSIMQPTTLQAASHPFQLTNIEQPLTYHQKTLPFQRQSQSVSLQPVPQLTPPYHLQSYQPRLQAYQVHQSYPQHNLDLMLGVPPMAQQYQLSHNNQQYQQQQMYNIASLQHQLNPSSHQRLDELSSPMPLSISYPNLHTLTSSKTSPSHFSSYPNNIDSSYYTPPLPSYPANPPTSPHYTSASRLQPPEGGVYREPPMLNDKLFPRDAVWNDDGVGISGTIGPGNISNGLTGTKGPHLQVRGLVYDNGSSKERSHMLDGISFEVRGGEILAVMSTDENEGTCLLDCLGGRHPRWGGRLRGDFLLNGNLVSSAKLATRCAYVQQNVTFCPDTSVRQTLLLHAILRGSGDPSRSRNVKARINALLEDLGLEQVKHTRVLDLTLSEKRRLNVACHLLLETDIVLLDQPTRGMDIFDTFFLVEYLRQWAGRGRIVILTIQPPTYEIFTMISRIVLVSTGRVMYFGRRREMLPYFAFIEYPCPAYKNPSDYYIDLVTLDDLSSEAMLESSQRVEMLADTFRRRQEALSDPGPPCALPPRIRSSNACITLLALWIRAMIYQFPYNLLQWLGRSLVAGLMSLLMGLVFWDTRSSGLQQQEGLNNRVSFYYVLSVVTVWPVLLMTISEAWRDKGPVIRDVRDGLYSRTVYIITKTLYSFLAVAGVYLCYCLPAYTMAGFLPTDGDNKFYSYVGHSLLYLFAINTLAVAVATVMSSRHSAAVVTAVIATVAALGSGYTVHPQELSSWTWPTLWWSPSRWLLRELVHSDLVEARDFACDRNPVMKDLQSVIQRKVSCGVVTGAQALRFLGLDAAQLPGPHYPALIMFIFYVAALLVAMLSFIFLARTPAKKKYHVE